MHLKRPNADSVFDVINYSFLGLCFLIVFYPLVYIISSSFSDATAVVGGKVWLWPVDFSLDAYEAVFLSQQIWTGYYNSFIYTIMGTCINIFMTVLAAYPLSRKTFFGRNIIMGIFAFTMLFSGGLIPLYLLVRSLGLLDTRMAMVIPNAMAVWNVILMRTYFQQNIPDDLYEAAELDGCRESRFLISIVLPLSGPIIAVILLFYAIGHWNSYFNALIFLSSTHLYPLQIVLRNILIMNQFDPSMMANVDMYELARLQNMKDLLKYSIIVVASAPLLILYPFVQKYFIRGIMIGALKG